jgi:MMP 1-O-methyltransferase
VAAHWQTRLGMVFIDGGHGPDPAHADYDAWAPLVAPGGLLAIHDVFEDPAGGGRPPYEVWCRAAASGDYEPVSTTGSLRVLRRC